jgi:hypothetical protein
MAGTVLSLLGILTLEVWRWTIAYFLMGATRDFADSPYLSTAMFSTVGYTAKCKFVSRDITSSFYPVSAHRFGRDLFFWTLFSAFLASLLRVSGLAFLFLDQSWCVMHNPISFFRPRQNVGAGA